jgi:hypothetical protein
MTRIFNFIFSWDCFFNIYSKKDAYFNMGLFTWVSIANLTLT